MWNDTDSVWVNVIADVVTEQWNNVSVALHLIDATFEIRLRALDAADEIPDEWEIDVIVLHLWSDPIVVINEETPEITNLADTDNVYANYSTFLLTANVSCNNGFADIEHINVSVWDNTQTTEYWELEFDQDDSSYSEIDASNYITFDLGASSYEESGNTLNVTWAFQVHWNMTDVVDVDVFQFTNSSTTDDSDWYEVNWDFESRLDYSVAPAVTGDDAGTVDRGDLDEAYTFEGTIIYYGSADDYPSTVGVDVWLSQSAYGTNVGPWSDLDLTSGLIKKSVFQ